MYMYIYGRRNIVFFIKNFGQEKKTKGTTHINLLIKRSLWSRVAHHQMDNRFLNKRRLREGTLGSHFTNKHKHTIVVCKDPCRGYHFGPPIVVWQRSNSNDSVFSRDLLLTTLPAVEDDSLPFIVGIFSLGPPSGPHKHGLYSPHQ